jgi:16S rRNA (cytosine967-C5)-methyltransferase
LATHEPSFSDRDRQLATAVAGGGGPARLLLDLWRTVRIDWSFASDPLAAAFRRDKSLSSHERRFVAETLYGLIRHLRRVDEALAAGGLVGGPAAPDRERLLAYLVVAGLLGPAQAAVHAPALDWPKVAAIDDRLRAERHPARRIARTCSLPDWLAERLVADHGDRAEALAQGLNQRAPMTVRANLLCTDRDGLAAALAGEELATRPGTHASTALEVVDRVNLFALAAFRRGWFEAQDEGSQLVAELCAPPPRALVIDYCAGAGGKTLALAAAMANRGRLLATDVDPRKLGELRRRARRAGVSNVQAVELAPDADDWPSALRGAVGRAARVLVDAPCTGTGALRRNPEARWRLAPEDIARFSALQERIVARALELVAPGGRLIYATCSVLAAENEVVIDRVRAAHPELELVPVKAIWGRERAAALTDASGTVLSLGPDRHGTDGFFAAVLRKPPGAA